MEQGEAVRDEHYWPAWDTDPVEHTDDLPAVDPAESNGRAGPSAGFVAGQPGAGVQGDQFGADDDELAGELLDGEELDEGPRTGSKRFREGLGKAFMITGGVIGVLVLLYAGDLMLSAGDVPRGVTVAGVEVGGMSQADAEATLRQELEPRLSHPVSVQAGDVEATLNPADSGLGLDWPATLENAGHQPLDPVTRVMSFFTTREVGVETKTAPKTLTQAINRLADTQINHTLTEGSIGFQPIPGSDGGVTAFPIEPRQGQRLVDTDTASDVLKNGWLNADGVRIPVATEPPKATSAGVHAALDQIVKPAVAKPVTVQGNGTDAVLKPAAIGGSFQFGGADGGALQVRVDQRKLQQALEPQLGPTEQESQDAKIVFAGGSPSVQPAQPGRKINWADTFKSYMDVIKQPGNRDITVRYDEKKPALTTEAANALGIKEVVGEFTTTGLSGDAAQNVKAIARQTEGAIVRPGQTFSLDDHTGPRTASQGYVAAPVNEDGTGARVIGGGVSQFTTTLYNAAYFAGLKDAGHTAHTYWMQDRYIPGRDAKSLNANGSSVDLKFTNDSDTGVAIQTQVSGDSVTVKIWGTKQYVVDSMSGGQSGSVPPPVRTGSGPGCTPAAGEPGFSTSDTRVVREIGSATEVRRNTTETTYRPKPTVVCG